MTRISISDKPHGVDVEIESESTFTRVKLTEQEAKRLCTKLAAEIGFSTYDD